VNLVIAADENMPSLELFRDFGEVRPLPGRTLERRHLADVDVLLVRSVTPVNADLLAGTPVRFVGSATIGTDHVDLAYLRQSGITFQHAPGCNARAVAEYVLQATLIHLGNMNRPPDTLTGAVIGCGNVGGQVATLWQALGIRVLGCDPPRRQAGQSLPGEAVSLEQALQADLVSLHVPLTDAGRHATRHLLDRASLARMGPSQLLINTSRGAVVDNQALTACLDKGAGPAVVLDVWETEPRVPSALFRQCLLGTPHIAGYSLEGKRRGSAMVCRGLCHWLGVEAPDLTVRPPESVWQGDVSSREGLLALLQSRYDIHRDHVALAQSLDADDAVQAFDRLRRQYPTRHECGGLRVSGAVAPGWQALLRCLDVSFHGAAATPSPEPGRPSGSSTR
jgi:erythronate-4-phosphate dehydrogenase